MIPVIRIVNKISDWGLLRDQQFRFQSRQSTVPHLASVVRRVNRHFEENSLAVVAFLDVGKAFETVWIQGLLNMLTILQTLNLPGVNHHILPPFSDV